MDVKLIFRFIEVDSKNTGALDVPVLIAVI
jgi:hypothetical protein